MSKINSLTLENLIFEEPDINNSLAWHFMQDEDWEIFCHYYEVHQSVYAQMTPEEQFMFLCFVALKGVYEH